MGITGGRLHLAVTEELADHRQALAEGERPRGVGVAQVVNAHVFQLGLLANYPPRCVQVAQAGTGAAPEDHPRVVGLPGQLGQDLPCRRRQRHRARAGLGIAQAKLVVFEVDVFPAQRQDFVAPAAGQHQQPEPRGCRGRDPAVALELVEHSPQSREFLLRQEALAASRCRIIAEYCTASASDLRFRRFVDGWQQHNPVFRSAMRCES